MQASFVKRGKSTDERMREVEEGDTGVESDENAMSPDKGFLELLLEATECGYTKVSCLYLLEVRLLLTNYLYRLKKLHFGP
jgi:hypothetical protein